MDDLAVPPWIGNLHHMLLQSWGSSPAPEIEHMEVSTTGGICSTAIFHPWVKWLWQWGNYAQVCHVLSVLLLTHCSHLLILSGQCNWLYEFGFETTAIWHFRCQICQPQIRELIFLCIRLPNWNVWICIFFCLVSCTFIGWIYWMDMHGYTSMDIPPWKSIILNYRKLKKS